MTMEEMEQDPKIQMGTISDALVRAIRSQLMDSQEAVVPGLGRFDVTYVESALNEDEDGQHFLAPPRNTISFTPSSGR